MPMRTEPRHTCRKMKREGPDAHPKNSQPDVSEATVSVPDELTMAITVSEAGQRNACAV